jgi:predicted negative regulator of RcsB-dependent stress response
MARVMAYKVRVASASGEIETAQKLQAELEAMQASTKDPNVYAAMKGGRGALLYYQEKYDDASNALQDDPNDMFSTSLLAQCYEHHGEKAGADKVRRSIVKDHTMDIDLALVQREIRGRLSDSGR